MADARGKRRTIDVDRLDGRATANPRFRKRRLQITLTEKVFRRLEVHRPRLNFGRGMNRSEFIEYCLNTVMNAAERKAGVKDFQKEWAIDQRKKAKENVANHGDDSAD